MQKYGAAVVQVWHWMNSIPQAAEGRFEVAKRIVAATVLSAFPAGMFIVCLTLTVSAEQSAAAETLKAITMCKKELGVRTVLGVSTSALVALLRLHEYRFPDVGHTGGLDLAIMNPNTPEMMAAVRAYRVLTSQDESAMITLPLMPMCRCRPPRWQKLMPPPRRWCSRGDVYRLKPCAAA